MYFGILTPISPVTLSGGDRRRQPEDRKRPGRRVLGHSHPGQRSHRLDHLRSTLYFASGRVAESRLAVGLVFKWCPPTLGSPARSGALLHDPARGCGPGRGVDSWFDAEGDTGRLGLPRWQGSNPGDPGADRSPGVLEHPDREVDLRCQQGSIPQRLKRRRGVRRRIPGRGPNPWKRR